MRSKQVGLKAYQTLAKVGMCIYNKEEPSVASG